MKKSQTELTYLRAAAQNATSVGLVIILYDLLIHDLEQAIATFADIERRTEEIKHSFLVLQQLEGSLDAEKSEVGAKHLRTFYCDLRCKIFEAHLKANPETLKKQIEAILDVRQAWQQVESPNLGSGGTVETIPSRQVIERSMAAAAGGDDVASMNWSA